MRPAERALKNPLPQLLSWKRGQFSLCLASYSYGAFPSYPGCRPASPGPQGTHSPPRLTVGLCGMTLGPWPEYQAAEGTHPLTLGWTIQRPRVCLPPYKSLRVIQPPSEENGCSQGQVRAIPGPCPLGLAFLFLGCSPWGRTWPTLSSVDLFVEDRPRELQ